MIYQSKAEVQLYKIAISESINEWKLASIWLRYCTIWRIFTINQSRWHNRCNLTKFLFHLFSNMFSCCLNQELSIDSSCVDKKALDDIRKSIERHLVHIYIWITGRWVDTAMELGTTKTGFTLLQSNRLILLKSAHRLVVSLLLECFIAYLAVIASLAFAVAADLVWIFEFSFCFWDWVNQDC